MRSTEPRLFTVIRTRDETGVSGTGRVIDGVVFHTGQVVVCWRSDLRDGGGHPSLGIYPGWEAFAAIHINSHPSNETHVEWREVAPPA